MSGKSSGRTIFFFCVWVFGCALAPLVFPELLMRLMGIAPADTLIMRIFGLVLLFLAYHYFRAGLEGAYRRFYDWTVHTRLLAMPAAALFVLLGWANPLLLAFVSIDLAGALWTLWALWKEKSVSLRKNDGQNSISRRSSTKSHRILKGCKI